MLSSIDVPYHISYLEVLYIVEQWKEIKESPKYSVSDKGRIKNNITNHIQEFDNQQKFNRYAVFKFNENGKPVRRKVHRLVAEAFVPNPDNKPKVNHISGEKYGNSADNLEWCTHSENMKHAYATGICPPPPSPLTGVAVFHKDKKECIEVYDSVVEASQKTGVPRNTIYCTLCQQNRNPVKGRVWLKIGRDICLTTSENKVD